MVTTALLLLSFGQATQTDRFLKSARQHCFGALPQQEHQRGLAGISIPSLPPGLLATFWILEVLVAALTQPQGITDALREPSSWMEKSSGNSQPLPFSSAVPGALQTELRTAASRGRAEEQLRPQTKMYQEHLPYRGRFPTSPKAQQLTPGSTG